MVKAIFLTVLAFSVVANVGNATPSESYIRSNAIPFVGMNTTKIAQNLKGEKVVTVGEMHGSNEAPLFVSRLHRSLGASGKKVVLGIEVPSSDQKFVDAFVRTKDRNELIKSPFFMRSYQDGRSSEAMVLLLKALPSDAVVVCFDAPDASSARERDLKMAENLIAAHRKHGGVLLVLAGNLHSSIEVGSPFDPKYESMGYFLHSIPGSPFTKKDVTAIMVRYARGNVWACMGATEAGCKVHRLNPPPNVYSKVTKHESYFLREPLNGGYDATVYFEALTASIPAF